MSQRIIFTRKNIKKAVEFINDAFGYEPPKKPKKDVFRDIVDKWSTDQEFSMKDIFGKDKEGD